MSQILMSTTVLLRKQELLEHWFPLPKSLWKTVPLLLSRGLSLFLFCYLEATGMSHHKLCTYRMRRQKTANVKHKLSKNRERSRWKTWNADKLQEPSELPVLLPSPISPPALSHLHVFQMKNQCFFHIWTAHKHTSTTLPFWDALLFPPLLLKAHRGSMCNSKHEGVLFWVPTNTTAISILSNSWLISNISKKNNQWLHQYTPKRLSSCHGPAKLDLHGWICVISKRRL